MGKGLFILALLLTVACPGLLFADPVTLTASPAGKGVFLLTGENVGGVQALDVEVEYDTSLLDYSYTSIVGGDVTSMNAGTPGKLLFSITRPVADTILQIMLNFDAKADTGGGLYNVSASSRDVPGRKPPDPDETADNSPSPERDGAANMTANDLVAASSAGPASGPLSAGTILEKSSAAPGRSAAADGLTEGLSAARTGGRPVPVIEAVHRDDGTASLLKEEKSVLERFRKFTGESRLKTFAALFKGSDGEKNSQEPTVALSDGKTPVVLTLKLQKATNSPDVALFDAELLSMRKTDEATLVITIMPRKGTWDARLVLATGTETIEFPFVVAPPVKIAGINEKNFLSALNAYISDEGRRGQMKNKAYLYNYIFTANYLARTAKAPVKTASR